MSDKTVNAEKEADRLRAIIVAANNALVEVCHGDHEHQIECHLNTLPDAHRRVASAAEKALAILSPVVLEMVEPSADGAIDPVEKARLRLGLGPDDEEVDTPDQSARLRSAMLPLVREVRVWLSRWRWLAETSAAVLERLHTTPAPLTEGIDRAALVTADAIDAWADRFSAAMSGAQEPDVTARLVGEARRWLDRCVDDPLAVIDLAEAHVSRGRMLDMRPAPLTEAEAEFAAAARSLASLEWGKSTYYTGPIVLELESGGAKALFRLRAAHLALSASRGDIPDAVRAVVATCDECGNTGFAMPAHSPEPCGNGCEPALTTEETAEIIAGAPIHLGLTAESAAVMQAYRDGHTQVREAITTPVDVPHDLRLDKLSRFAGAEVATADPKCSICGGRGIVIPSSNAWSPWPRYCECRKVTPEVKP